MAQTLVCDFNFLSIIGRRQMTSSVFYRRNLPHWHPRDTSIFLTWRLYGSLPQNLINRLRATRQELLEKKKGIATGWTIDQSLIEYKRLFARVDAVLDRAEDGSLWLRQEDVAALVQQTLLESYATFYRPWSFVIMPNHLHLFLKPKPEFNNRLYNQTSEGPHCS